MSSQAARFTTGQYRLDPLRTQIRFRIRDLFGVLPVAGSFTLEHGTVSLTEPTREADLPGCVADLRIAAGSFTTGNRARDRQVRGHRFLHTAVNPSIDAHLEGLEPHDGGYRSHGTVTVRGRSAPVAVDIVTDDTARPSARARVSTRIDRYALGVTGSRGLASRWVDVTVELTAEPSND